MEVKKYNIITKLNGVGLQTDTNILLEILGNENCNVIDWVKPERTVAETNIHLEHIRPELMRLGKRQILIPNPEWFQNECKKYLSKIDIVLAKTHDAERIFKKIHKDTRYIGWTSPDRMQRDIKREDMFLHVCGKSSMKGTDTIVHQWNSQWPKLIVIGNCKKIFQDNIWFANYLEDSELKILQNSCRYHICTSEYEGFGHYINEARSVGAIIISTNAAPMNEIVKNGFLCNVASKKIFMMGLLNKIDHKSFIEQINNAYICKDKEKRQQLTRIDYEQEREDFINRIKLIL